MNFIQKRQLKKLRSKVEKLYGLNEQQANNLNTKNAIDAFYQLAAFYAKHTYDKDLPHAKDYQLECYRAAAKLGDVKAQYLCGERLLEKGRFWDSWSRHPIYGASVHGKYAAGFYEEGFAYLHAADASGYALAKRAIGLANINGWGVAKNPDQGFKLVLESIDEEKAWDRATKIFEELKLNSPEFFAALRNFKGGSS